MSAQELYVKWREAKDKKMMLDYSDSINVSNYMTRSRAASEMDAAQRAWFNRAAWDGLCPKCAQPLHDGGCDE